MTRHKDCYGTLFPDSLHSSVNQKMRGKVFEFELYSLGLARSNRNVNINLSEWDDCQNCVEFEQCYKLCMAKLTLETAISQS